MSRGWMSHTRASATRLKTSSVVVASPTLRGQCLKGLRLHFCLRWLFGGLSDSEVRSLWRPKIPGQDRG
jgi:hypothetical protein